MNALTTLALVLLTFGGHLNATYASLGVGVNLILMGAVLCGALLLIRIAGMRAKIAPVVPLVLIALAFAYGIAIADTYSLYGENKLELLLTLTPLSFVAGAWLADTDRRREWLAWGVAGWGLVVVLVQQAAPDATFSALGRFAGEDLSYQALSNAAAAGSVVLAVVALSRRLKTKWRLLAFVAALAFTIFAVGGGSRGPILGLVIAVVVVAFRTRAGAATVAVLGLVTWYLLPRVLLPFIPDRLLSLNDGSTQVRADAASMTVDHIRENPLGTGFGSLEWVIAPIGERALYYPHNIVLEVAGEAGILAAVLLVGVIVFVGFRLWRDGTSFGDNATLALLVYFFVNACVSGDVNSNRGLWLILGVACAAAFSVRASRTGGLESTGTTKPGVKPVNLASGRWS